MTRKCMCTQINVNHSRYNEDLGEIPKSYLSVYVEECSENAILRIRQRETTWRLIWTLLFYIEHETIEERVLAREVLKSCGIIRLRYIRFAFAWKLNGVNYIFSKAPISVSRGVAVTITENVGEITFTWNV